MKKLIVILGMLSMCFSQSIAQPHNVPPPPPSEMAKSQPMKPGCDSMQKQRPCAMPNQAPEDKGMQMPDAQGPRDNQMQAPAPDMQPPFFNPFHNRFNESFMDRNIMPVAPFIFVIIILLIVFTFKHFKTKQKNELLLKFLQAGQTIPKEYFEPEKAKIKSNIKTGILLTAVGIGITLTLGVFMDYKMAAVGLIPLLLGIGYIVLHFIENKKKEN